MAMLLQLNGDTLMAAGTQRGIFFGCGLQATGLSSGTKVWSYTGGASRVAPGSGFLIHHNNQPHQHCCVEFSDLKISIFPKAA